MGTACNPALRETPILRETPEAERNATKMSNFSSVAMSYTPRVLLFFLLQKRTVEQQPGQDGDHEDVTQAEAPENSAGP